MAVIGNTGMTSAELKQIEHLRLSGSPGLSFADITSSLAIQHFANLAVLDISDSGLRSLPDTIYSLSSLVFLDASGNQIDVLSDELGRLTRLQELHLRGNRLRALPPSIGALSDLRVLSAGFNELEGVPKISCAVKELHLPGNQITEFPGAIHELTVLEVLDLEGNAISELPDWLEERLPGFRTFKIEGNRLQAPEVLEQREEQPDNFRRARSFVQMPRTAQDDPGLEADSHLVLDALGEYAPFGSMEWYLCHLYRMGSEGYRLTMIGKNTYLPKFVDATVWGYQAFRPVFHQGCALIKTAVMTSFYKGDGHPQEEEAPEDGWEFIEDIG